MLKTEEEVQTQNGVGVFVGRFQTPFLTDGHKELFNSVISRHHKTICIIGLSVLRATKNNPLDYEARRKMITDAYPEITIQYIQDHPDDTSWSNKLDKIIDAAVPPGSSVFLYGSRDSFINHYHGRHSTKELVPNSIISATEQRMITAYTSGSSVDFRKGVIWATNNQYPTCYGTTDIAIMNENPLEGGPRVLLGRKSNETLFRFIGGFNEPDTEEGYDDEGNATELDAAREVHEETGCIIDNISYVGTFKIDDWRYKSEADKIRTMFFMADYAGGDPHPDDDICELRWFNISHFSNESFLKKNLVHNHCKLMRSLLNFRKRKNK